MSSFAFACVYTYKIQNKKIHNTTLSIQIPRMHQSDVEKEPWGTTHMQNSFERIKPWELCRPSADIEFCCIYRNFSDLLWGLALTSVILTVLAMLDKNDDDDDDGPCSSFISPGLSPSPFSPSPSPSSYPHYLSNHSFPPALTTTTPTPTNTNVVHRRCENMSQIRTGPCLRERVTLRRFLRRLPTMPFVRIM